MKFRGINEIIQGVVAILAVLIGGGWTYKLFIEERQHYPHINIEQKVSHVELSDNINLLRVGIGLTNTGKRMLILKKSIVRIQQLSPVLSCEKLEPCAAKEVSIALNETVRKEDRFSWPLIAERLKMFNKPLDIEPGEKDIIDFEFAIPSNIKVIRIYSYFRNEEKSANKEEVGWSVSTYYDFGKAKKKVLK